MPTPCKLDMVLRHKDELAASRVPYSAIMETCHASVVLYSRDMVFFHGFGYFMSTICCVFHAGSLFLYT